MSKKNQRRAQKPKNIRRNWGVFDEIGRLKREAKYKANHGLSEEIDFKALLEELNA